MCGIGGIRRLEDDSGKLGAKIVPSQIDLLVNSLEYRGNDAAGVALVNLSGDIHIYKDHEAAWKVTAQVGYKDFITRHLNDDVICVLVHTRKATKGSPYRNDNNHPLSKGAGVVVHNGVLHNDDRLFTELQLERGADTDSDILRAILDAENGVNRKSLKAMSRVGGSVAAALVHPADPTKLMLLRSGNPLVLADDGVHLYFASDKRAIYRSARPWFMRHGFPMQRLNPNLAFLTMPNDTGYIIGSKGLEWHDAFTSAAVKYRYQNYSDVYSPTSRPIKRETQKRTAEATHVPINTPRSLPILPPDRSFEETLKDWTTVTYVVCPNPTCGKTLSLTDEQSRRPMSRFLCKSCKTCLGDAMKSMRALQKVVN